MSETTPLIKAALNLRVGAGFDVYGFFCLAIIKGPPNDNYFIIEGPCLDYFTEKVSQTRVVYCKIKLPHCKKQSWCSDTSALNHHPEQSF